MDTNTAKENTGAAQSLPTQNGSVEWPKPPQFKSHQLRRAKAFRGGCKARYAGVSKWDCPYRIAAMIIPWLKGWHDMDETLEILSPNK